MLKCGESEDDNLHKFALCMQKKISYCFAWTCHTMSIHVAWYVCTMLFVAGDIQAPIKRKTNRNFNLSPPWRVSTDVDRVIVCLRFQLTFSSVALIQVRLSCSVWWWRFPLGRCVEWILIVTSVTRSSLGTEGKQIDFVSTVAIIEESTGEKPSQRGSGEHNQIFIRRCTPKHKNEKPTSNDFLPLSADWKHFSTPRQRVDVIIKTFQRWRKRAHSKSWNIEF